MKRISRPFPTVAVAAWLASTCCAASAGCEPETSSDTSAPTPGAHVNPKAGAEPLATSPLDPSEKGTLARGEYLVTIGGCHDCHTPLMAGPTGPTPDMTRALSGHPQGDVMPDPPAPVGPWIVASAGTNTAHHGPWGTSFTANLTPDDETGLGSWDADMFMATIRNGKHLGRGRSLLPPMPWFNYAKMTDDDLKAVFAYLQSVPAVSNRVPAPVPPSPTAPPV